MLLFVRGGTVLPIKQHNRKLSLSRAFFMPIRLEIYLSERQEATGTLFFDDGVSFSYQKDNRKLLISYKFANNSLTYSINNNDDENRTFVEEAYYVKITQVHVFNLKPSKCPDKILERKREHREFVCDLKGNKLEI